MRSSLCISKLYDFVELIYPIERIAINTIKILKLVLYLKFDLTLDHCEY